MFRPAQMVLFPSTRPVYFALLPVPPAPAHPPTAPPVLAPSLLKSIYQVTPAPKPVPTIPTPTAPLSNASPVYLHACCAPPQQLALPASVVNFSQEQSVEHHVALEQLVCQGCARHALTTARPAAEQPTSV